MAHPGHYKNEKLNKINQGVNDESEEETVFKTEVFDFTGDEGADAMK